MDSKKIEKPSDDRKKLFIENYIALLCNKTQAAKRAGVTRQTVNYWEKHDDDFVQALDDAFETLIDSVESVALKRIFGSKREYKTWKHAINHKTGEIVKLEEMHIEFIEPSDKLIEYFLKTKGRDRGWNERVEIEQTNKYNLNDVDIEKLTTLSTDEKQALLKVIDKINA